MLGHSTLGFRLEVANVAPAPGEMPPKNVSHTQKGRISGSYNFILKVQVQDIPLAPLAPYTHGMCCVCVALLTSWMGSPLAFLSVSLFLLLLLLLYRVPCPLSLAVTLCSVIKIQFSVSGSSCKPKNMAHEGARCVVGEKCNTDSTRY